MVLTPSRPESKPCGESGYSVSTTSRPASFSRATIGLAACDRIIVVGRAVEDADRARRDFGVGVIGRRAVRIERDVAGELHAGLVPELVEAVEARVERRLSAARKSHQHDALGVDARMLRENLQRMIDVDDEIEPAEQGLVRADAVRPRPEKPSITKVEIPIALNWCTQASLVALTPLEPCIITTTGRRPVPCAMRNSPATVTGLPLVSPVRNCWSEMVSDGIA